ncbi:MAG: MarR family transcriptional regulator [Treponema sp.]|nr:MarR family transcriptional regulator [Treponema sp.]
MEKNKEINESELFDLGFYFKKINDRLAKRANTMFAALGLTLSQTHVILLLGEAKDKTLTQKELEVLAQVSHPTINGIITRLKNNGFVTTEMSKSGRLSKSVTLTKRAIKILDNFSSSRNVVEILLNKNLTKEEDITLKRLLDKVFRGLENTQHF